MKKGNQKIRFRIKKIVKQGKYRSIFIPKTYLPDFAELGEHTRYDVVCIPLPELEEGER